MGRKRRLCIYNPRLEAKFKRAVRILDIDTALESGLQLGNSWEWICVQLERESERQESDRKSSIKSPEERRALVAKRFGVPVQWVMLPEELEARRALRDKPISSFLSNLKFSMKAKLGTYAQIAAGLLFLSRK